MNDFQAKYLTEVSHRLQREGGYGVEFVTWERIRNNTGLWQGHYYDNNYAAAKQDFAVRSGLIRSSQIFTKEQIEEAVPQVIDLANELTQSPKPVEMQLY